MLNKQIDVLELYQRWHFSKLFIEILDQAKGKIVTENVCLFYTCPRLHKNNRFSSFLYE